MSVSEFSPLKIGGNAVIVLIPQSVLALSSNSFPDTNFTYKLLLTVFLFRGSFFFNLNA